MNSRQTNKNNHTISESNGEYWADNVSKYFGEQPGLVNVNLTLNKGQIHCVCGANAAGKTTIVRVLAGLLKPDKGKITQPEKKKTGLMLEYSMLYPKLSIAENLRFYAGLYGVEKEKHYIDKLLESLGLDDLKSERIEVLSAGMQKRASFARAIINKPELVLLDEPFSGLDQQAAEKVKANIKELAGNKSAVLITTHWINQVIEFCDEFSVLDKGRLIMNEKAANVDKQAFCRDYVFYARRNG